MPRPAQPPMSQASLDLRPSLSAPATGSACPSPKAAAAACRQLWLRPRLSIASALPSPCLPRLVPNLGNRGSQSSLVDAMHQLSGCNTEHPQPSDSLRTLSCSCFQAEETEARRGCVVTLRSLQGPSPCPPACQPPAPGRGPAGTSTLAVGPGASVSAVHPNLASPRHLPWTASGVQSGEGLLLGAPGLRLRQGRGKGAAQCVWEMGGPWSSRWQVWKPHPSTATPPEQPLGPSARPAKWSAGLCLTTSGDGDSFPLCTALTVENLQTFPTLTQKVHSGKQSRTRGADVSEEVCHDRVDNGDNCCRLKSSTLNTGRTDPCAHAPTPFTHMLTRTQTE